MRRDWSAELLAVAMVLASGTAGAQTNLLVNGGFETALSPYSGPGWTYDRSACLIPIGTTAWTCFNTDYSTITLPGPGSVGPGTGPVHSGTRSFEIANGGHPATLAQPVTVTAGTTYLFTTFYLSATAPSATTGAHPYVDAGMDNCQTESDQRAPFSNFDVGSPWSYYALLCTPSTSGTVTVQLGAMGLPNGDETVIFDDASVVVAAPEPNTLALLSTGLMGLAPLARRTARRRLPS